MSILDSDVYLRQFRQWLVQMSRFCLQVKKEWNSTLINVISNFLNIKIKNITPSSAITTMMMMMPLSFSKMVYMQMVERHHWVKSRRAQLLDLQPDALSHITFYSELYHHMVYIRSVLSCTVRCYRIESGHLVRLLHPYLKRVVEICRIFKRRKVLYLVPWVIQHTERLCIYSLTWTLHPRLLKGPLNLIGIMLMLSSSVLYASEIIIPYLMVCINAWILLIVNRDRVRFYL